MRSRRAFGCLFILTIWMVPFPATAQGPLIVPEAEALGAIGSWLAGSIESYLGGKAIDWAIEPVIDKVLGRDKEKKLREIEARLQNQIDRNTSDRKNVEKELSVAKSELRILHRLIASSPNIEQLARDRKELASDLETIRSTLAEHEKRLDQHDRALAEQGKLIESQGRELEDLKQRVDSPYSKSPVESPAEPRRAGADLRIEVRGTANLIRLREATHPVLVGTFKLSRNGVAAAYFLPQECRAVVEIFAPGNRISIPAGLAQRVQILDHGYQYEKLIY